MFSVQMLIDFVYFCCWHDSHSPLGIVCNVVGQLFLLTEGSLHISVVDYANSYIMNYYIVTSLLTTTHLMIINISACLGRSKY